MAKYARHVSSAADGAVHNVEREPPSHSSVARGRGKFPMALFWGNCMTTLPLLITTHAFKTDQIIPSSAQSLLGHSDSQKKFLENEENLFMTVTSEQVEAGQAIYTQRTLAIYDFIVLGISNRFVWKCPTGRLVDHYHKHLTSNHLDVGVGTGYFLDRCQFPSPNPRLALMDLNPESLEFAARRIVRYQPETFRRNVLEPISWEGGKFDSVGINYLLHCVPGSIEMKSIVFDHLMAVMNPHAILFGSTLLQGGVRRNWFAKRLMRVYNKRGIFWNQHDNLEDLKRALNKRFKEVSVEVVGCAALFAGRL